jgi:hypothetical protein
MGENYIPIDFNTTKFLLASNYYIDKASVRVKYTADMYYSRQFYPSQSDALILNFYVVDAYKEALDRIDFKMVDSSYYNSKLLVYKSLNQTTLPITEGYFDASHFFTVYLMEDSDYYLRTINPDGSTTEFGRISIVKPEEKQLSMINLNLNPQAILISNEIFMNAYTDVNFTTLYVRYDDSLNQTEQINITIYFANGTTFESGSWSDTSHLSLDYNISMNEKQSYTVRYSLKHQTLGNSPIAYEVPIIWGSPISLGLSTTVTTIMSLGILLLVGGLTTRLNLVGGLTLFIATFLILMGIGWLATNYVLLTLIIIIGILTILVHLQGGVE